MKKENSFVGQIDLLALLGAELREIDSKEYIVIPVDANPTIEIKEKKSGGYKAKMEILLKDVDGKFGNSHFVKAIVSKILLDKMSMTYIEARQFSPILGNVRPLVNDSSEEPHGDSLARRERRPRTSYPYSRNR